MSQVDGHSLRDVNHHKAVSLLKATQNKVVFKIEKNALQHITPLSTVRYQLEHGFLCQFAPTFVHLLSSLSISLLSYPLLAEQNKPTPFDSDSLTPRYVFLHRPEGASLGLMIACGKNPPGIFISGITSDGVADSSGAVSIGDEILEVC